MAHTITMADLLVDASHLDARALLREWQWLVGNARLPFLLTALGDAFLQDVNDGSIHLLAVGEGTLEQVAVDMAAFETCLQDRQFVLGAFVPGIVARLHEEVRPLAPGEVYSYRVAPRLGGDYAVDNLAPCDITQHFDTLGRAYRPQDAASAPAVS